LANNAGLPAIDVCRCVGGYWHYTILGKLHRIKQLAFFPLMDGH
jgi:hypothetical protein